MFFSQKKSISEKTSSIAKGNKSRKTARKLRKVVSNTNQSSSGNWSINKCKEFIESRRASKGGEFDALRHHCFLALEIEKNGPKQGAMSLN